MDLKDRIRHIMETQQMTQKDFAQYIGISEASLSGIFNDRTRPSLGTIESLHNAFPNISTDWLMYGSGDMFAGGNNPAEGAQAASEMGDGHPSADVSAAILAGSMMGKPLQTDLFGQVTDGSKTTKPHPAGAETATGAANTVVKYVDKPQRKITEIRIFYDDQTYESFTPGK